MFYETEKKQWNPCQFSWQEKRKLNFDVATAPNGSSPMKKTKIIQLQVISCRLEQTGQTECIISGMKVWCMSHNLLVQNIRRYNILLKKGRCHQYLWLDLWLYFIGENSLFDTSSRLNDGINFYVIWYESTWHRGSTHRLLSAKNTVGSKNYPQWNITTGAF